MLKTMNCWDILGIGPVANKAELKKACAAQLKLHHPEDDPAGFQRLREAYEQALIQAKYRQQTKAVASNEALPQMTAAAGSSPQEEPSKMLIIPVAPFFMAATYLILLYKEQLGRIFSSMP